MAKQPSKKTQVKENKIAIYTPTEDPLEFYISEDTPTFNKERVFSVFYDNPEHYVRLLQGDCIAILNQARANSVDMIFADPPYFLSNGGITCQAGKMVSVNKGKWDESKGVEYDHEFTLQWLNACRRVLKDDGTIWVSGTMHNVYSVGYALQKLGYKLLNDISWFKPNAAPNLSCRYFTHSHETVIWAAKSAKSKHKFDYQLMKKSAGGKQMRSLWTDIDTTPQDIWVMTTPKNSEKTFGKHPTQKPLTLLERIVLASTDAGDLVLDPFTGSSTAGIAAVRHGRHFVGIDTDAEYLDLSVKRFGQEFSNSTEKPKLIKELV